VQIKNWSTKKKKKMNTTKEKSIRIQWLVILFLISTSNVLANYLRHGWKIYTFLSFAVSLSFAGLLYYFAYVKRGTKLLLFSLLLCALGIVAYVISIVVPNITFHPGQYIDFLILIYWSIISYRLFCLNYDYHKKKQGKKKKIGEN